LDNEPIYENVQPPRQQKTRRRDYSDVHSGDELIDKVCVATHFRLTNSLCKVGQKQPDLFVR